MCNDVFTVLYIRNHVIKVQYICSDVIKVQYINDMNSNIIEFLYMFRASLRSNIYKVTS